MNDQRLTPWGLQFLIADTTARTNESFFALIVREDTIIDTLSDATSGKTLNMLVEMGFSGKTLKAGDTIFAPKGNIITNITLTSGSVMAYSEGLK